MEKLDEGIVSGVIVDTNSDIVVGEFHVVTYDEELNHLRKLAGLLPLDAEVEKKDAECACSDSQPATDVKYATMDFFKNLAALDAQAKMNELTLDAMKSAGITEEEKDDEPELTKEYEPISSHPGTASIKIRNPGKYADNPLALPEGSTFKDYFKLLEEGDSE